MARVLARLAPRTWLPRPTARLRLTLLYGTLFLASGAALLAVTYVLAWHATTVTLPAPNPGKGSAIVREGCAGARCSRRPDQRRAPGGSGSYVVHLSPSQGAQLQTQVDRLHDASMHRLLIRSAIALAVMAIISVALGWLVAGRVLRPVRTISAAARRIGASNLDERLGLDGPDDEFRELAATLDDLLERLQASFESQRHFVANASHELRTPLTLDRALLERALRNPEPSQSLWRATCERLLASGQQQARLIEALLTFARSEGGIERNETCELGAIIDKVLLSPELDTNANGVQIQIRTEPAPVIGDPRLLERLIRNLIDNAIRHNTPNGHVEVTTRLDARHSVLTVANTGPLVPAGDIDRLLQPFQRAGTDRTGHGDGLGLGLSIVQAIATAHEADVKLHPRPDGGLRINVSFRAPTSYNGRHDKPGSSSTRRLEPSRTCG